MLKYILTRQMSSGIYQCSTTLHLLLANHTVGALHFTYWEYKCHSNFLSKKCMLHSHIIWHGHTFYRSCSGLIQFPHIFIYYLTQIFVFCFHKISHFSPVNLKSYSLIFLHTLFWCSTCCSFDSHFISISSWQW